MFAEQVRVDPQDNIWVVDQMTNYVIKFDPEGRVAMLLGRKPEAIPVPAGAPAGAPPAAGGGAPGAGPPTDIFDRPTHVPRDDAGAYHVSPGTGNTRVAISTTTAAFPP